ncbi:MAG: FKBP-type peptidyl-prolyl cis-trans isomerase [Prevotella sp.]|nr:FKBP-type peptidyl-prolyl cis-trans isomerase [Prevotella sp.]
MKPNKYINASYKLYDISEGKNELLEETNEEQPFSFISGLGILLDAFEREVVGLETGSEFDFVLTPAQAYGEFLEDNVLEMDKELFYVNGQFDEQNVYKDAIIPLQDETGKRFNGRVVDVTADKVTIDLNHPLAGKTLNFKGKINETREATNEELSEFVENLTGQGEGCGCGGNCGCGDGEEGSCGCGGNHKEGECCGGHNDGECCGGGGKGEGQCCCNN